MASPNKTKKKTPTRKPVVKSAPAVETPAGHINHMGGKSWWSNDPLTRLRLASTSCFFGEPKYYSDTGTALSKPTPRPVRGNYLRDTLGDSGVYDWAKLAPVDVISAAIDAALDF